MKNIKIKTIMKNALYCCLLCLLCLTPKSGFAQTNFVVDSLSDTAGTLLSAHTGATGATWALHPAANASTILATTSPSGYFRAGTTTNGDTWYTASGVPSGADYSVQVDVIYESGTVATGGFIGVGARMDTAAKTGYLFGVYYTGTSGSPAYRIYRMVGGTGTVLVASGVQTFTNGQAIPAMKLTVTGSTLTGSVNGATVLTTTDSSITAAGRAGIATNGVGNATDTSGALLKNFVATTPPPLTQIGVTNSNIYYSPYNWYFSGSTYAQTETPGAYLRMGFTGTTAAMVVDVSTLTAASVPAGSYPNVYYSVDSGSWQSILLTSTSATISLATGLAAGSHTLTVLLDALGGSVDKWTTPANVLRITGFTFDNSATFNAIPIAAKRVIVFGDSITEARRTGSTASSSTADGDASLSWARMEGQTLGAEWGICAYQGQGFTSAHPATGNVPPLWTTGNDAQTSWNKYDANHSRLVGGLLSPPPDIILVMEGTNDNTGGATDAAVTASVIGLGQALRAASPSAKIYYLSAPGGYKTAAILAGVAALGDANTAFGDISTVSGMTGTTSLLSSDGTHPNSGGAALLSSLYGAKVQSLQVPVSIVSPRRTGEVSR